MRSWFAHQALPRVFVALLGVGLLLMVGPLGCRLLCSNGCCSEDSDCPICILAHTQGAPATEPVSVAAQLFLPLALRPLGESESRPADDHQLLPSRAPPTGCTRTIMLETEVLRNFLQLNSPTFELRSSKNNKVGN